jgi:hypothetical protein
LSSHEQEKVVYVIIIVVVFFYSSKVVVIENIDVGGNGIRQHSTIGYLSPVEFERKVGLA